MTTPSTQDRSTDLIERLRDWAERFSANLYSAQLMADAASELQRLRQERDRFEGLYVDARGEIETLISERN